MPVDAEVLVSHRDVDAYAVSGATQGVTIGEQEAIQRKQQQWGKSVDVLLEWFREAGRENDARAQACIETALDLVSDWRSLPVPTSIAQTGDGGVAFDWRSNDEIVTIEILDSGVAELTRFLKGRVILEARLARNPRTQRLERDVGRA